MEWDSLNTKTSTHRNRDLDSRGSPIKSGQRDGKEKARLDGFKTGGRGLSNKQLLENIQRRIRIERQVG